MSVKMQNKWGDIVEMPESNIQIALNSGYTYVNQPAPSPTPTPQPVSQPKSTQQVGSTQPSFDNLAPGQSMEIWGGPDKIAQARAAGLILTNGRDINSGWETWTVTKPAANQQASQNTNAARQSLQTAGINVSGLSDDQVNILNAMYSVVQKNAANDKPIAPLTPQDMNNFMSQAKSELDPYYQEQLKLYQADIAQTMSQLTGDVSYLEQQQTQAFQDQQEQLAKEAAAAGLARSGLRQKAESKLSSSQQGLVESTRRQLKSSLYGLGSQVERAYGAAGISGVKPISYMGSPISYTPTGVQMGTAQKEQTVAETQRQQQLANTELQKRYSQAGYNVAV